MEEHRDIYTAPDKRSDDGRGKVSVDHSPAAVRARMRRNTIRGVLLMVLVLLVAWLIVYMNEQREEEKRKALTEQVELPEVERPATSGALFAEPKLNELSDTLDVPVDARLTEGDRLKVAEAMGEIRVAQQFIEAREWDSAEMHARKALEIWPDMNVAKRLMGFVYTQRGQFDQAIAALEAALEKEPFSAETYNNLAAAYMQKWELDKAEDLLVTSLEIRPNFHMAHINLGLLYLIQGRYEDTIEHLELALERLPENVASRNNLAVALLRVGRYDEARKQLQYIIDRHPDRASAYFNMAITYVLEQNLDQAMKYIELGRQHCSPVSCRNYLADSDFDPLRGHPAFQAFINSLYPELPALPKI